MIENNIDPIVELSGDPEEIVNQIATVLTSYANAMGNAERLGEARRGLEHALRLNPRHLPAWVSFALVEIRSNDCSAATAWADKVLAFEPDPDSVDPLEQAIAAALSPEGERLSAEALQESGMVGAWRRIQDQMRAVKEACEP